MRAGGVCADWPLGLLTLASSIPVAPGCWPRQKWARRVWLGQSISRAWNAGAMCLGRPPVPVPSVLNEVVRLEETWCPLRWAVKRAAALGRRKAVNKGSGS